MSGANAPFEWLAIVSTPSEGEGYSIYLWSLVAYAPQGPPFYNQIKDLGKKGKYPEASNPSQGVRA